MTAQEIKAARADLGKVLGIKMTQKDMAKMLCVSKRTYEYWESKSESSVPIPEWVPEMIRLKKMEFKLPKVVSDRQMKELRNRPESITGWNNRAEHPELITLREQVKVLTQYLSEDGYDMLRIIDTVKYLRGIAERGTGRLCDDNETTEQFVLGYVKELEGQIKVLREALRAYSECCDGCTCGDGWDHDIAIEALEQTKPKDGKL